ncbi:unnamed protein product [Urochloa humidicola]
MARALLLPLLVLLALAALARAGEVPSASSLGYGGASSGQRWWWARRRTTSSASPAPRQVLQGGNYISYGALQRDNVPCSVRDGGGGGAGSRGRSERAERVGDDAR